MSNKLTLKENVLFQHVMDAGLESAIAEAILLAASRAAFNWLTRRGLMVEPDDLFAAIERRIKLALPAAIADYQQASGLGMHGAARQAFSTSMTNAGVEAAKECAGV